MLGPQLRYDVRRWSTVFPFGMYAACSFVVGAVTGTRAITDFARVWVWVSVAVWSVVFVAMARRGPALVRDDHPPTTAARIEGLAGDRSGTPSSH